MIGLALEGGGAKGSYQAGAYMAMKKCHIHIDAVVGTSIGSLNAAFIASHEEDKMVRLWRDATMSELLGIDEEKATEILKSHFTLDKIKMSFTEMYKVFKNKGLDMSNYRALVRNSVDEKKLRKSNIRYGLTTIKLSTLEPLDMYIEDIPEGKLHDYITASSYLPVFKKEKLIDDEYYLDGGFYNLSPSNMLEKIGCNKIYVINIKGIGFRRPRLKSKVEFIEIKPNNNLGSVLFFDQASVKENMTRGYYDTMRALGRLDGVEYYFKRKSDWYYRRLNHRISSRLYKAAMALLGSKTEKETVIMALEYILKKEKKSDLIQYKQKDCIKLARKKDNNNIVYEYVENLTIW